MSDEDCRRVDNRKTGQLGAAASRFGDPFCRKPECRINDLDSVQFIAGTAGIDRQEFVRLHPADTNLPATDQDPVLGDLDLQIVPDSHVGNPESVLATNGRFVMR